MNVNLIISACTPCALIKLFLLACVIPLYADAATITVNSTNDPAGFNTNLTVGTLGPTVTLRDAVTAANNTPGDDVIAFDAALSGQTIRLYQATQTAPVGSSPRTNDGLTCLRITSNIELIAPAGGIVIVPNGFYRIFDISAGSTVRVERVSPRGAATSNGGAFWNDGDLTLDQVLASSCVASSFSTQNTNDIGYGGVVYNNGTLTADGCTFQFNNGQSGGGAIWNADGGSMLVTNCTFFFNISENAAAAIGNESTNGLAVVVDSTFSANKIEFVGNFPSFPTYSGGGAIANSGTLYIARSTFTSNTTDQVRPGGAIANYGDLAVDASTFAYNSANPTFARGGAIFSAGTLGVSNATFTVNAARFGSAVENESGYLMRMANCTVARNVQNESVTYALDLGLAADNLLDNNLVVENERWDAVSSNFVPANVIGSFTGSSNVIGIANAQLGSLANNGGPVKTMALAIGSPAVDAGIALTGLTTDARGTNRVDAPDAGAYELPTYAPIFTSPTSAVFVIGQSNSFQVTVDSGLPVSFLPLVALPTGIDLTLAGLLSGNPTVPSGLYPLGFRAFHDYTFTDANFQLIVNDGTTDDRYSWRLNGDAALTNGTFTLTDGTVGETSSAWYLFKQDINAFEASFEYLSVSNIGSADGMAFVLQNAPAGIDAIGGGGLGYTGIIPSFALLLNIYAISPGGQGIQIGTAGAALGPYIDSSPANPASGDPIKVELLYVNGVLDVTMSNLVSSLTYTTNFTVDIPAAVNGNQSWVGLTAATGGDAGYQYVSNFMFTSLSAISTVIVNNATDPGGFDPNILLSALGTNVTLRDAVNAANNNPGPVIIRFDPALAGSTIDLLHVGATGDGNNAFPVTGDLTIENTTGGDLTIRRGTGGDLRLFRVVNGGQLTLRNLILKDGRVSTFPQGGGIVRNEGHLLLDQSILSGGYSWRGGAVYNAGTARVERTLIERCTGEQGGGGIFNSTGTIHIVSSTLNSNVTYRNSGEAGGGGLLNIGTATLTNCTIAYNLADNYYYGAIHNFGSGSSVSLVSCTIFGNRFSGSGGTPGIGGYSARDFLLKNTILADASDFDLLPGSTNNLFFNPGLGPYGDNGGPTPTFPITTNSAAYKAGLTDPSNLTDQRGFVRHTPPDIGAYEIFPRDPLIVSTTVDEDDGTADSATGTGTSLREALAYAQTLTGTQTITFASALAGQTVVLDTGWTNATDASALRVTNAVVLQGLASAPGITLAIDASAQKRHFLVEAGGSLTVQDLTLTGGYGDNGGSIWNFSGSLVVRRCTFYGNEATAEGGAIQVWGGSPLFVIENSTIASNTAAGVGSAMSIGAISNSLTHITVTGNTGPQGSFRLYDCVVPIHNSIVAGNIPDNIETQISAAFDPASSGNLFGTGNSAGISNGVNGNIVGVTATNLLLGGLSSTNGGPTPTCALLIPSPAINAGTAIPGIATEQRGSVRVIGARPDAGAVEFPLVESGIVTTIIDEDNGTSDARYGQGTSLREAILYSSSTVSITNTGFAGANFVLTLVGDTNRGNSAIVISTNRNVSSSVNGVTISCAGPHPMRAFRVLPGRILGFSHLTLTGGQSTDGGFVLNEGRMSAVYCTFTGNTADSAGGAIFTETNAYAIFLNSTFTENTAGLWGGALANRGSNQLTHVTASGNEGAIGGGAIFNYAGSETRLINTIVAGNRRPGNDPSEISGPQPVTADSAYNLIGTGEAVGLTNGINNNLVGVADPRLGPLTDNGGRTPTMALLPGSPAIDAGNLANGFDQRTLLRVIPVDIGAYELLISTNAAEITGVVDPTHGQGAVSVTFPGNALASYSAYATTNLMMPVSSWEWLGVVPQTPPGSGQFNFTMPVDTNKPRYYIGIQSP